MALYGAVFSKESDKTGLQLIGNETEEQEMSSNNFVGNILS